MTRYNLVMKFDGRGFAQEIERVLKQKMSSIQGRPKIVSVLVGDDPASVLYTRLKKEAAERIGIDFEVVRLEEKEHTASNLQRQIREIGANNEVTGLMVQLPIADLQGQALQEVLEAIPLNKDVDGLRYPESKVIPPVVEAVLKILEKISETKELKELKYVVIGAKGFVGSAVCLELEKQGKTVIKVDSDTTDPARSILEGDVIISCTGKEGMVIGDMVRDGSIVIDVGAPRGDMTQEVYQKASVSVEVPGGVGPVTIACLMQNAVEIYGKKFISRSGT